MTQKVQFDKQTESVGEEQLIEVIVKESISTGSDAK